MITIVQYFTNPHTGDVKAHTTDQEMLADALLAAVQGLLVEAEVAGVYVWAADPDTGTLISGAKGGSGDGGFRAPESGTGAPTSSHREARGLDVYDSSNLLDNWIDDDCLTRHGLYREHPDATPGWCHLTTRSPGSGRRTFRP